MMVNWKEIVNDAKQYLNSNNIDDAQNAILSGLEKAPHQFNLLQTASQVFRASGDRERSLKFAQQIISRYPRKSQGYKLAAQDLLSLKRFDEAQNQINAGLEIHPRQFNLLLIAANIYRVKGEHKKSLEYARLLINHHPDEWKGHAITAQGLVALKKYKEAEEIVKTALKKFPNQVNLLNLSAQVFIKTGKLKQSLECAYQIHKQDGMLPRTTFNDLLIHSANQANYSDSNNSRDARTAVDFYFNSRFILSSTCMPFNFIYAPKNACSSIKLSLLARYTDLNHDLIRQNPHKLANELIKQKVDWDKPIYCLVRNPYARFISAFTDKCRPGGDRSVWPPLCKRYGFDETKHISMDQLLDALLGDDHNRIDPHLRPQYKVLCASAITPVEIFRMEEISTLNLFLRSHNIEFLRHAPHSTKAKAMKPNELGCSITEKLKKLYREDFDHYGYSEDPNNKQISHRKSSPNVSKLLVKSNLFTPASNQIKERDSILFMSSFLESSPSLEILCSNADKAS